MNEDLRGSIETAGKELYTLDKYLKDSEMETLHGGRFRKMIKALKTLITTAEQVLEAESELPEKLKNQATATADGFKCVVFVDGTLIPVTVTEANFYNYALDLCLPILAKYKMKVKELEDYNKLKVHYREEL
jgi:anion-transporting  ArsA/GET3 family ATPase